MMDVRFAFPLNQLPWWLFLGVAGIAALVYALRALDRHQEGRVNRFVEAALAPRLLVGYDARLRRPLFWFTVLGFAMLALTFAQPRWGKAWVPVQRASRDILILLDTSESMNAQNPLPTRLGRARQKIEAMLDRCPGDRFGMIAFSGNAALQCPLTPDHAYFKTVLNSISTNSLSEEGTDIEEALLEAERVFEEDAEQTGEANRYARAILLISDGEQVSGDAVKVAKRIAAYATVHVLGIGDPKGAQVKRPVSFVQNGRESDGERFHLSKLDERTLSKIAVEGGGVYVRTTPVNKDIDHIHKELEILASRAVSGDIRFSLVNRYRWPLSVAIACFFFEGLWIVLLPLIRQRRLRRAEGAGHA